MHARDRVGIVRHEHEAGGVALAERDAGFGRERTQEGVGGFHQQAAAVAAESVGGDAAAMLHACECVERLLDQRTVGRVVELRDQPETAAVALVARIVEARPLPARIVTLETVRVKGAETRAGTRLADDLTQDEPTKAQLMHCGNCRFLMTAALTWAVRHGARRRLGDGLSR